MSADVGVLISKRYVFATSLNPLQGILTLAHIASYINHTFFAKSNSNKRRLKRILYNQMIFVHKM